MRINKRGHSDKWTILFAYYDLGIFLDPQVKVKFFDFDDQVRAMWYIKFLKSFGGNYNYNMKMEEIDVHDFLNIYFCM